MQLSLYTLVAFSAFGRTVAFLSSSVANVKFNLPILNAQQLPSFLDKLSEIPNPFEALKTADIIPSVSSIDNEAFDTSPAGLIRQAKRVVAADMGIQQPSLLDDNFRWLGPVVDEPLGKTDYLAAGRFFDLRSSFPDLDYRAHDFRIDEEDAGTVRLTCRVVGTMRGELRLRGEILQPSGKTMKCPPEAVTMTFDPSTGKVLKMTTGFPLDRLMGNTAGTTGVIAASTVAGKPVSDWEIYPPAAVVKRFFGRPVKQLPEPKSFLAPFPETVMIQLAKGILAANMASEDESLLGKSFTYCTPTIGPIRKKEFLSKYAATEFEGVDPSFSHFRVDPYNPNVVWVDVRPSASGYRGAPQAMSFTFDDDGFCTRITSGAVIDPTIGNGGGLAGVEGYRYAKGDGSPALATRPLPRIFGRLSRRITSLITRKDADDYDLPKRSRKTTTVADAPAERLSTLRGATVDTTSPISPPSQPPGKELLNMAKSKPVGMTIPKAKIVSKPSAPVKSVKSLKPESTSGSSTSPTLPSLPKISLPSITKAEPKKRAAPSQQQSPFAFNGFSLPKSPLIKQGDKENSNREANGKVVQDQKRKAASEEATKRRAALAQEAKRKASVKEADAKRDAEQKMRLASERAEAQRKREQEATKKREEAKAIVEASRLKKEEETKRQLEMKRQQQEAQRQKANEARAAKAKKPSQVVAQPKAVMQPKARNPVQQTSPATVSEQEKLEAKQKQSEEAILRKLSKVASSATIGLLGFGKSKMERDEEDAPVAPNSKAGQSARLAPFGVPTLSSWRKNFDGSVSGNITGSANFRDGEKITTSAISGGTISSGEVVVTASGSKYFLT